MEDLEKNVHDLDSVLSLRKKERDEIKTLVDSFEAEVKELRNLADASKRWVGDSFRISVERDQVKEKEVNFRLMNSDREGRDLKQVEAELSDSIQKQADYTGKFSIIAGNIIHNPCKTNITSDQ